MKLTESIMRTINESVELSEELDATGKYDVTKKSKNQWSVKKQADNTDYLVKKSPAGNLTCTCTGYKYNNKCKHVDIVKEMFPEEFVPAVRHPREEMPLDMMHEILDKYDPNWTLLGSGRREKDTFKDIDVLVDCSAEEFRKLAKEIMSHPEFTHDSHAISGDTLVRGIFKGYYLDINRADHEKQGMGAMLLYRTGPADLNTFMRQIAIGYGWSLSEKGLTDHVTGDYVIDKEAPEEEYFTKLGLPVLTPKERDNWRAYIDENKERSKAELNQKKVIARQKWIWDLAKDYQEAMEAGNFSDTDNYLRKYALKYAKNPTGAEMRYAFNIANKRLGGNWEHSPNSKKGREAREAREKAQQQTLDL